MKKIRIKQFTILVCLLIAFMCVNLPCVLCNDQLLQIDLNQKMTLHDIMKITLLNNPDIQHANAKINQAQADIQKSNAVFFPSIHLYSDYVQGDEPIGYLMNVARQRDLPPMPNFNQPGWFENYEVGVKIHYQLFNGGRNMLGRSMAKNGYTAEQFYRQSIENTILSSVIQTYYDAIAADDFTQIAKESVATVEAQLNIMQVRFNAGGALKSDVLSLDVRLAQAKEDLVTCENHHKIALAYLANISGLEPDIQLQLVRTDKKLSTIPDNYYDGVKIALDKRSEIKQINEQVKQSQTALQLAKTAFLPTIAISGTQFYDDDAYRFKKERKNWAVGVNVNWTVFNGFNTSSDIAKATAQLKAIEVMAKKTKLAIQLDVKKAYLNLEDAIARLQVAESSVKNAEESFNLVKKQYEGGSVTITRYLESELDLNRARIRATAAFYDKEKGVAEIARTLGYWGDWKNEQNN